MPQFIDNPEEFGLPEDLVAIGGELNSQSLIQAYSSGVFPWPEDDELPILWFCPDPRGILRHEQLHISRSLRRTIKKGYFTVKTDTAFDDVIEHCQTSPRTGQNGTWITPKMKAAYRQLHKEGIAHSVEAWTGDQLVGGMYGVYVNNSFSGESMFRLAADASKVALVKLVQALHATGLTWIDTQMITPVVESLGGELIAREEYFKLLKKNRDRPTVAWSDIARAL